ncbi:serine protease gd-like [Eupeodes corollae]|uniref:serine protease gd-like n=1 Tax=Eupeodes corollae TaxID=290404 RepID=UPI00249227EE|nr:serine protease gd-like [Eupeodes corollae]
MFLQLNVLTFTMTLIVCFFNKPSACQTNYLPAINCPNVFQYSYWGNNIIGIITINGIMHGKNKLVVELSQPGAYNLDFFGKLSLNLNKQKVFEYIERRRALTFNVEFPLQNIVPRVTSIDVNGIQICSGLKYDLPSTTIKLDYTLTTFPTDSISSNYDKDQQRGRWQNYNYKPKPNEKFSENINHSLIDPVANHGHRNMHNTFDLYPSIKPFTDVEPSTEFHDGASSSSTNSPATLKYINSICGQENLNYDVIKLNVKGTIIRRSRFPWISAVFKKIRGDFSFQCGGSLISTRTVISAAHCFYSGLEQLKPENILISMGLHDLTSWLDDAQNFGVQNIIQHPDYNPTHSNFDADLAVVRLKRSVMFTTSIRPICMWQGSLDIREIEGTSGAVVGWGADNNRNTTSVPTLVNATVVSEITCLRSNSVFISLTSNRTLCAGNLDGSGPCMGDSGNGLIIKKGNKWLLRGTVSAALGTPNGHCILDNYAIYSDIAKFSDWIYLNMLI